MTGDLERSGSTRRGREAAAAGEKSPPATPVVALRMEGLLALVRDPSRSVL